MRLAASVLIALALSLTASTAFAAAGHDEGFPFATLLFSTINVILFVLLLRRVALPAIRNWAQERHDRILRDLEAAADARAAADKLKAEWEARIAGLDAMIEGMRAQAKRDAEIERDRILVDAQRTAERIQRDAEQAATAELRELQAQLRSELTSRAIQLAQDTVRREWTDADQTRFVADFVKQVHA